jgi:hypothetical protein
MGPYAGVEYNLFLCRLQHIHNGQPPMPESILKIHKIEIFFGFDFEICIISLLVMSKY